MSTATLQKKIEELPEAYLPLVDGYVDDLLERSQRIAQLRGIFAQSANDDLRSQEKNAWQTAAARKHSNA